MFKALRNIKRLGFTMIELLIVIAVLGILAVAVLAQLTSEQINRGRDTGSRSDAEQLISASIATTQVKVSIRGWLMVSVRIQLQIHQQSFNRTLLRLDSASVTVELMIKIY
jgi:prepilin-type N-terminal cleavage/methylation domain-containing protein